MKRGKRYWRLIVASVALVILIYPQAAYANSSWHWLTSSPMEFLPLAILLTLAIEMASIFLFGKLVSGFGIKLKVAILVILANIFSFVFPYILRAYQLRIFSAEWQHALYDAFHKGPYYIVLSSYLILTLLIEVPLVYYLMKKHSQRKKQLLIAIISANVVTTFIVAIVERMLFYGQW